MNLALFDFDGTITPGDRGIEVEQFLETQIAHEHQDQMTRPLTDRAATVAR
jgi:phosphoserine phosphatase